MRVSEPAIYLELLFFLLKKCSLDVIELLLRTPWRTHMCFYHDWIHLLLSGNFAHGPTFLKSSVLRSLLCVFRGRTRWKMKAPNLSSVRKTSLWWCFVNMNVRVHAVKLGDVSVDYQYYCVCATKYAARGDFARITGSSYMQTSPFILLSFELLLYLDVVCTFEDCLHAHYPDSWWFN